MYSQCTPIGCTGGVYRVDGGWCGQKKRLRGGASLDCRMRLGFFFVVFLSFFGFGFGFGDFVFGAFGGWSSRSGWLGGLDWLSISDRSSNSVAFSGEGGVTLDKDDDTFDETPDTATHDGDIGDEHQEAEEEAHEWDFGGQSNHDGGKHDENEATTSQSDMDETFLFLAEIPVVSAESTEEDAEQTGGDRGFDAGRDGVLESRVVEGIIAGWGCVWRRGWIRGGGWVRIRIGVWILVHKDLLNNIVISLIIAGFGGKSKGSERDLA